MNNETLLREGECELGACVEAAMVRYGSLALCEDCAAWLRNFDARHAVGNVCEEQTQDAQRQAESHDEGGFE